MPSIFYCLITRFALSLSAVALMGLSGCTASLPAVSLDKARWSGALKTEGVSVRLYQTSEMQFSCPGCFLGWVGQSILDTTQPPTANWNTAKLLADDLTRELDLASSFTMNDKRSDLFPLADFDKSFSPADGERRFVLKVGIRTEVLNHLPMAWATNQYWLAANAALIDRSDQKTIWQGSCWISLDPNDKSRQVTNEQLSSADGQVLLASVVRSATRQCAAAMNKKNF